MQEVLSFRSVLQVCREHAIGNDGTLHATQSASAEVFKTLPVHPVHSQHLDQLVLLTLSRNRADRRRILQLPCCRASSTSGRCLQGPDCRDIMFREDDAGCFMPRALLLDLEPR